MDSQLHSRKIDNSIKNFQSKESLYREKDQLKRVQQSVELMRNRVQLLKNQLQKQTDSINKHKSMTNQVVKQKIVFNQLSSIKNRDVNEIEQKISQLRHRNHSYRQQHRNQMNSILKAVYLVKLDDARQIKSLSQENRLSLEKINGSYQQERREMKKAIVEQSEIAKRKYLEYWKNKLNSVYAEEQKKQQSNITQAKSKKQELQNLKQEQLKILQSINQIHKRDMQAKKQYLAAQSLSHKDVAEAVQQQKLQLSKAKISQNDGEMVTSHSESIKSIQTNFFTKDPHISILTTSNIRVPRTKLDQSKFQIILKMLKKSEKQQK